LGNRACESAFKADEHHKKKRIDNLSSICRPEEGDVGELKKGLGELKEKRFKGEMTEKDFEVGKKKILDENRL